MHSLAVKLDGIERRKRSTGLLHIAAACFLLAKTVDYLVYFNYKNWWVSIPAFVIVALSLGYGFFKKSFDPQAKYNHWVRMLQVLQFTVLGLNFISLGRQLDVVVLFVWAIICLFLLFTERKVFEDSHLQFKKEGILIPGYFSNRRIFWGSVKEVVARPDYVTIFLGNNKFYQLELLHAVPQTALQAINMYSQQQINAAISKN